MDEPAGASPTLHPMGECALLVELAGTAEVLALFQTLRDPDRGPRPSGVLDLVPAETTLLVTFDGGPVTRRMVHDWVGDHLARRPTAAAPTTPDDPAELVTLPVTYDGPDLDEVAALTGLGVDEVIAAHTSTDWTAAFCGFVPGFAYLTGGDARLRVARHNSPRTRVPAGAVALAGQYSAVYPRTSPGGWRLIGRTGTVLWNIAASPPALIRPGVRVRFVRAEPSVR